MTFIRFYDRIIEFSIYALFFLVPLIFTPWNFELFEFNKMTLVYLLTIVSVGAFLLKGIAQKEFVLKRTPLDIPILLFLAALLISTVYSVDVHTSIWGYYSRFNGGLASIACYILLYYVFVNTMDGRRALRALWTSLAASLLVVLWGIPSHFGHDPTCLLIQGSFDTSCWTEQFKPELRIFSTLGQPNWLAAYLSILLPIAIALGLNTIEQKSKKLFAIGYMLLAFLFYIAILFTNSRSGFLGLWAGLFFFGGIYLKTFIRAHWYLLVVLVCIGSITFVVGTPFEQVNKFTLQGIRHPGLPKGGPALETGGTDSGEIRKIVWQGAIDIAKHYPLFGSGVETFAYSYYRFRPTSHNMTSEWDFLYNKAHNEYLNYAATTGFLGLGAYLFMIITFLVACYKNYVLSIKKNIHNTNYLILNTGLFAGYISILVSNFAGFSVVVTNLYLFLIPAFVFVLNGTTNDKDAFILSKHISDSRHKGVWAQRIGFVLLALTTLYLLLTIIRFWVADTQYAQGYNLDRANQFAKAYQPLFLASSLRSDEPVFYDELAINNAMLATFFGTSDGTTSAALIKNAITLSDHVVTAHPSIVTFWKTRARLFYSLTDVDEKYLKDAITAIEKAHALAPTDAKVTYNLAVLYGQNNQNDLAIKTLEETLRLKPDYRDAYYALGLFYNEKGDRQRAIEQMEFILSKIASDDAEAKDKLESWR